MSLKSLIQSSARTLGYEIRKFPKNGIGGDPHRDIAQLVLPKSSHVVFDVGANFGTTIDAFRKSLARPTIHAFEPAPQTFRELQRTHGNTQGVHLNIFALGSKTSTQTLIENTLPEMSSFLEPSATSWGKIKQRTKVTIRTIDEYCAEHGIAEIDILKSDAQGYDLEVIKGSKKMLSRDGIHLIYLEIILSEMYKNLPRLDQIFGFLFDYGFSLVTFYEFYYQNNRASWTDALFINERFTGSQLTLGISIES